MTYSSVLFYSRPKARDGVRGTEEGREVETSTAVLCIACREVVELAKNISNKEAKTKQKEKNWPLLREGGWSFGNDER